MATESLNIFKETQKTFNKENINQNENILVLNITFEKNQDFYKL